MQASVPKKQGLKTKSKNLKVPEIPEIPSAHPHTDTIPIPYITKLFEF